MAWAAPDLSGGRGLGRRGLVPWGPVIPLEAPPSRGPSRLELRYLESLPPLYYALGALWIGAGLLPFLAALGVGLGFGEILSDSAVSGLFELWKGCFYVGVGLAFVGYGAALVAGGFALARRRRPAFCRAVGWLACLFFPFGTLAGVMTLLLLRRPRVRTAFAG